MTTPANGPSRPHPYRPWLIVAIVLAIAVIAAIPFAQAATQRGEPVPWTMVWNRDFTTSTAGTAGVSFSHFDLAKDEPVILPSRDGLMLDSARTAWIDGVHEGEDVRVSVDLVWPEAVDGFEIMVNSRREQPPQFWMAPAGILAQFGGYSGIVSFISANESAGPPRLGSAVGYRFEAGRPYRLTLERRGDEIEMQVDGRVVHRHLCALPPAGTGLDRVAIRTWSRVLVRSVTIEHPPATSTSTLLAGDLLVGEGLFSLAAKAYGRIAAAYPGTTTGDLAAMRCYFCALRMPEGEARNVQLAEAKRLLAAVSAESSARQRVLEADCLATWKAGRHDEALMLMQSAFRSYPSTRIVLDILAGDHAPLPPAVATQLLRLAARTDRPGRLDLANLGLSDLTPLRGLQLESLVLDRNGITDLAPLAGMRLTSLSLSDNAIANLAPLAGMPIEALTLTGNPMSDITALAGMPLRRLVATDCRITDLAPVRSAKALRYLVLGRNPVSDLAPLAGLPLQLLDLSGTGVQDPAPLRGMPLATLEISQTQVADLSPLAGMQLRSLAAQGCRIEDLAPLRSMPLESLLLSDNRIADLAPLAGLPLRTLAVAGNRVVSLAPLSGMPLQHVDCSGNAVRDLAPISGCPISSLAAERCGLTDLAPLAGMPLTSVRLSGNDIADVSPLGQAGLSAVFLTGNPVTRFGRLAATPPALLVHDGRGLADGEWDAQLLAWSGDAAHRARVDACRAVTALRRGGAKALRAVAGPAGPAMLWLPIPMPLVEAQACAQEAGGRLVEVMDAAKQAQVLALLPYGEAVTWLGLDPAPGGAWRSGAPVSYNAFQRPGLHAVAGPKIILAGVYGGAWLVEPAQARHAFVIEWDQ